MQEIASPDITGISMTRRLKKTLVSKKKLKFEMLNLLFYKSIYISLYNFFVKRFFYFRKGIETFVFTFRYPICISQQENEEETIS